VRAPPPLQNSPAPLSPPLVRALCTLHRFGIEHFSTGFSHSFPSEFRITALVPPVPRNLAFTVFPLVLPRFFRFPPFLPIFFNCAFFLRKSGRNFPSVSVRPRTPLPGHPPFYPPYLPKLPIFFRNSAFPLRVPVENSLFFP